MQQIDNQLNTQPRVDNPKFYLSSFNKVITMQMNPAMAIQLYVLVTSLPEVSKELYAASEKIKTQLFHMQMIHDLDRAIKAKENDEQPDSSVPVGEADSREHNGGTGEAALVQAAGGLETV